MQASEWEIVAANILFGSEHGAIKDRTIITKAVILLTLNKWGNKVLCVSNGASFI